MNRYWFLLAIVILIIFGTAFYFISNIVNKNMIKSAYLKSLDGIVQTAVSKINYKNIGDLTKTQVDDIDLEKFRIISMEVSREHRIEYLQILNGEFEDTDYHAFYSNIGYGDGPELVCIIKCTDMYDILRAFKTNGTNYDIDTDNLINKLDNWDREYGLSIIGADFDWVDVKFDKLPQDVKAFSEEIYEFCPDAVDQGVGSIEELGKYIKENKSVFLWWD